MTFDPYAYSIMVRREPDPFSSRKLDDYHFVARVAELPDMIAIDWEWKQAYLDMIGIIEDAFERFEKDGHKFPEPEIIQ